MSEKYRIHAELHVEKIGVVKGEYGDDPKCNYIAYSPSFMAEDQISFECRPSQLEATLRMLFRTEDPMMKKTQGILPNTHTSFVGKTVNTQPGTVTQNGKQVSRHLLTRDPIYAAPEGSTRDLIMGIGREVLGRNPGSGMELFGELLDDIITPKKRKAND